MLQLTPHQGVRFAMSALTIEMIASTTKARVIVSVSTHGS